MKMTDNVPAPHMYHRGMFPHGGGSQGGYGGLSGTDSSSGRPAPSIDPYTQQYSPYAGTAGQPMIRPGYPLKTIPGRSMSGWNHLNSASPQHQRYGSPDPSSSHTQALNSLILNSGPSLDALASRYPPGLYSHDPSSFPTGPHKLDDGGDGSSGPPMGWGGSHHSPYRGGPGANGYPSQSDMMIPSEHGQV